MPKERKKVNFRRRAGAVRTDDVTVVDARGDTVRRRGRKASAQASLNREAPSEAATPARRG
jgi:hypothetical protein